MGLLSFTVLRDGTRSNGTNDGGMLASARSNRMRTLALITNLVLRADRTLSTESWLHIWSPAVADVATIRSPRCSPRLSARLPGNTCPTMAELSLGPAMISKPRSRPTSTSYTTALRSRFTSTMLSLSGGGIITDEFGIVLFMADSPLPKDSKGGTKESESSLRKTSKSSSLVPGANCNLTLLIPLCEYRTKLCFIEKYISFFL